MNAEYLLDVLAFHAKRGNASFDLWFNDPIRAMLTKSPDGKSMTVTMPIHYGEEAVKGVGEAAVDPSLAGAIAAKNFDQLKALLDPTEAANEANRAQFSQETDIELPETVAGTENTVGEFVMGRLGPGKLPGGREAGGTTIIPDLVAEALALSKDLANNPMRLLTSVWEMAKRNLVSATTYMRTLGAPGRLIASDLDDITYRVTKHHSEDMADIRIVLNNLGKSQRELLGPVMNGRIPETGQRKLILDRMMQLRGILDRAMRAGAGLGMTRGYKGGRIPLSGKGKAFPQVPNAEGMRFLEEGAAKGKGSARVFAWAQEQVKAGKFKTVDDAVTALQKFRDTQLRGINRYLETSRVELPMDMVEWDPARILSVVIERNWMTVEGIRKWGIDRSRQSFPRVNSRIEAIRAKYGADHAQRVKNFIQTSFGLQSPASRSA
jgi:hypothetical protein